MRFLLLIPFLVGCETVTPYYEGGLGHTLDSGSYVAQIGANKDKSKHLVPLEEKCVVGMLALGVELEYDVEVEIRHTSCINHTPEISMNSIMITKRGYFK